MTWRHDVTTSYKWKFINIFELSDLKNFGNKKESTFKLIYEIWESSLGTSGGSIGGAMGAIAPPYGLKKYIFSIFLLFIIEK